MDLVGGHVVLSKTHSGEYTNSVVYRGKLIGMAGRDASELAGFWARATVLTKQHNPFSVTGEHVSVTTV